MAVITFIHRSSDSFRVLDPNTLAAAQFRNRRLDIDDADPMYRWVADEAARNPEIVVMANVTTCPECGELFPGKTGAMDLGRHRKAIHPIEWDADRNAEHAAETAVILKTRAGFACDVCQPVQTFGTADDLGLHTRLVHGAPFVNADGTGVPDDTRDAMGADSIPNPDRGIPV